MRRRGPLALGPGPGSLGPGAQNTANTFFFLNAIILPQRDYPREESPQNGKGYLNKSAPWVPRPIGPGPGAQALGRGAQNTASTCFPKRNHAQRN